ncbi:MAG: ATP-dependent RNA helicase HrpA [Burkholderiales bacterium]|nr:ATP-dependent RNA helicase HrpA [Burkholderiales bacterium]
MNSDKYQARLARIPSILYPEELPIAAKREEIARAIQANQVVVVAGETGSGKTTQLPKICLDLKRGAAGMIGCTQPRRIAARTVAGRIAYELQSPLGDLVGYKVRFTDKGSSDNLIKVMTDGILLAETQTDRLLKRYDTLIIDEAHERSLNIDFLLGYLKQLLPRRPDLKIIITSATINTDLFSRHFNNAPVVEVSGRLYPVEMRYRPVREPVKEEDKDDQERDMEQAIVDAVDEVSRLSRDGDVLIFLPGEREIRDTAELLRKHHPPGVAILPLYARQTAQEQERVFQPTNARRIILATNVAETSLTVPGIRYVIDPGYARFKRYSYRNKVDQLLIEPIAQASANQRAGRCGRVSSGVCMRLYSEADFQARPRFADPEILRTSLAGTILRMAALGLGDIADFPFIEPPASRAIADGYGLLQELNAVDEARQLTPIGAQLAKLTLDPKLARMLLAAHDQHCVSEMLVIASALSVQDPRIRPMGSESAADIKHKYFVAEHSDFMGLLKIWAFYVESLQHKKSNRKLVEECHSHFLSYLRLREWHDLNGQLAAQASELGLRLNPSPATYEQIHRALLAGLIANIGVKADEGHYQGAREIKFHIHPGSSLFKKGTKWLMAAELTETGKLYARNVAKIEPEWVEQVGAHLIKRHYFDPHWEKSAAQVVAFERTTLYGLTLTPRRRVHFGAIDPKQSREIFIRSALVAGQFESKSKFFLHNQALVEEIRELEHKSRRPDVLVDEERMFAFFDARIPADIVNGHGFEKWRREAERKNPQLLCMQRDDLMRHGAEEVTEVLFPDTLLVDDTACPMTYRFDPGHPLDGVTLTLPLHLLNRVNEARCAWLVPGMVRDKVTALLKGLPKGIRNRTVPVQEFVTAFLISCPPPQPSPHVGEGVTLALAAFIRGKLKETVAPEVWEKIELPTHLHMNYRVVDDAGQELAQGRNLAELKQKLGQAAQMTFAQGTATPFDREGITQWDFGDLPEKVSFNRGSQTLTGYPALVDEGENVSIHLFDTAQAANESMRGGVRRLLMLALKEQIKQLEKNIPNFNQLALQARNIMAPDVLKTDLLIAIADRAFIGEDELPRDEKAFIKQRDRARARLQAVAQAAARIAADIFTEYHALQSQLAQKMSHPLQTDLQTQLAHLIYPHFLSQTPWEHLQQIPRYLKAIQRRLEKRLSNAERDGKHMASVRELWQQYEARMEKHRKAGIQDEKLSAFRWMLEELRVSLFAQELKTPYPVSYKRLAKAWEEVAP